MVNGKQIELRDGDALDILADRWRRSNTPQGESAELPALVAGLLKETGRPLDFTKATPANMAEYELMSEGRGPRAHAASLDGELQFSAFSSDYWSLPEDEVLVDGDGEPMILVIRTPRGLRDALTGAPIHVEHP